MLSSEEILKLVIQEKEARMEELQNTREQLQNLQAKLRTVDGAYQQLRILEDTILGNHVRSKL